MEIKVNIPQNDYRQPTEVREDVVQKICDVFLDRRGGCYHNVFHPSSDGCYRVAHRGLRVYKNEDRAFEFDTSCPHDIKGEYFIRIHGTEMKAAFEVLIKAGYHMFKIYEHRTWMGYICDKKPIYKDWNQTGVEVHSFNDFID